MHLRTFIASSAVVLIAVLVGLVSSSATHAAGGSLVAAYAFDEGTGTTVRDSSPQGNDGTARDTTWSSSGRFGGALAFNGTSSWVTVPDSASLDFTKGFTIEAWVKPAADMAATWQTIAFKEGLGDLVYALYANGDTSSPAAVVNPPNGKADARGLAPLAANVWSYVATTWDGSTLRVFVNGNQVSTRTASGTLLTSTGALHLGGNAVRGEWFNGQLDDLRMYGQPLSASRIGNDMTTPVVPPAGPPPSDITPPSTPTGLTATNVATSSITMSWTASTDNVGVTGYDLFRDGLNAGTTTAPVSTFTGLSCGTSYTLGVDAVDAAGNVSGRQSATVSTLACPDTSPPSAPSAFAAGAIGTDSITTSWTASTDNTAVAGYTLYLDGVATGTAATPLFTFSGLVCGTSYALEVEAFDAAGNLSPRTALTAVTAPCPDLTAPSAPASFTPGTTGTTSIATSWAASSDNVGVNGYSLYRDGVHVGTTTLTLFTFSGLACGTSYLLEVDAFDAAGNVSARTTIRAATAPCPDVTAPSAPSALATGSITGTSIALSWTASTDDTGVAGYTLYRDGASVGTSTAASFTFGGLACGTSYALGVEALDAAGNLSPRTALTAATAPCADVAPPSAPTALVAKGVTKTSIGLFWTASTDNVGVAGYRLYRGGISVGTTTATSFNFAGLSCGSIYVLSVEAFDAAGNVSTPRPAVTAATSFCGDLTPPTAPGSFVPGTTGATSIATSWAASTDNFGVTGYTLYRDGINVGATTSTLFTFSGLACGTSYALGVEAFDAAGNVSPRTSISASTSACPDVTPPSAPSALAAGSITRTSVVLSWVASTDNVGVTGYRLYRDGVSAGTSTASNFGFTGLSCGTSYVLGVEALDAAGNVSPRQSVTAATAACPDVTPPTTPTGLAAGTPTTTSIPVSWTASTDAVGVTGYTLYRDGTSVGSAAAPSFSFGGLSCGTNYVLGVEAFDAAGNVSPRATVSAGTAVCPDTTPPTAPSSFAVGATAPTSISTSWSPSTDNVGVAGYTAYRDGVSVATISGASVATAPTVNFTFVGLTCGTSYALAVEAFDAAGNVSLRQSVSATTTACVDTTAPQVAVTAPAAASTVSGPVRLAATATDAGGVASVQFTVDGVSSGAALTSSPYTLTWDSLGVPNGSHTIAARATDNAGNATTSAGVSVTVQNALDTTNAFQKVDVGPGFMDAALHGVIRTAAGRVYVFAADDTAERKGTGPGVIHAYRADQLGIPTSFTEVDAAHRPSATGTTHVVGSPDVRLAANGVAHMVYTDETNATLWYETFSTATDTWGARVSLATGVDIPAVAIKRETSNALVLDANDVPHVAYAGGGVVQYRDKVGGAWNAATTVSSGGTPIHVGLAAAPDGAIDLSWLQGSVAPSSIMFAQRSPVGTWSAPETVASGDVLDNTNADQGPSVAYSATGEPYVLYVSAKPASAVRVRRRSGGAWTLDPTPVDFFTHTPQIYMQGNDLYAFLGHDVQIRFAYAYHLPGQAWSTLTALTSTLDGTLDGSASTRWDPLHETNAAVIDTTFFDEDMLNNKTYFPEAYYMAVLPSGTGAGGPPGPTDNVAPTVSMTAPAAASTVSGSAVAVSANAADNVAVAGVQFKLDGANLGTEDVTAPYAVSWNSTAVSNGTHTLTAVARDAAGNGATATSVTVTTSNATAPPPTPAGTVLLGNAATESKVDSDAAGEAEAFKTTASVTGSVARLRVFLDASSTAGSVVVGLYTNSASGHPGTLLATGTITAPAAGQNNEVAVAPASVTAGQTYWIAVLGPTGTIQFRDRGAVGAGNSESSQQKTLTALPATWTSGAFFSDGFLSAVGIG